MKFTFFQIAIIALQQSAEVAAANFAAIGGDFGSVNNVDISMGCSGLQDVPNTRFTIQPSDNAEVSSSPPNLVTASVSGNRLSFSWNPDVAATASEAGVIIGLPAANLQSVSIDSERWVQILDGFTSVTGITVRNQSVLKAMLVSNEATYSVDVSNQSTVDIKSTSPASSVRVYNQSPVSIDGDVVSVRVSNQSPVSIDGDVVSGTVTNQSPFTVTGDISGNVSGSNLSSIRVGTISGQVSISGQSSVENTASCDNVSTSDLSRCFTGDAPSVSVDVSEESLTLSGIRRCNGSSSATVSSLVVAAVGGARLSTTLGL
eukprot:scaffold7888_cov117-Skeletonema_menzelii.AAC.4